MDWFVRAFVKTSLSWFGAGVLLGLSMAIHPSWTVYRTAHIHMNLLGFVAMMIFGVAYHVMPRFASHPLHSRRLAGVHWWLANTGLALFVIGLMAPASAPGVRAVLLPVGGLLSAAGAYAFIYNIWRTLDASSAATVRIARPSTREPGSRRLGSGATS